MIQKSQILFGGGNSAPIKNQVERIPVKADKKLSIAQIVGDFSLIPTSAKNILSPIGSVQLRKTQVTTATKSVKNGFRVIAKW